MEIATNPETKHERDGFDIVDIKVGDIFNVPRGVRHRPIADGETGILMVEKVGTVNTGDEQESEAGKARTVHVEETT